MCGRRFQYCRYIFLCIFFLFITQALRHTSFVSLHNDTYNAELHPFIPPKYQQIIFNSSAIYTVKDLVNITDFPETFDEFKLNSSKNSIHLITQWYYETNLRRRRELVSVLHMNVINPAITNIHFIQNSNNCTVFHDILLDETFPTNLLKSKLVIHYSQNQNENRRLTINQALQYANHFITTGYTVLLNLDNFFDRSLLTLTHRPLLNNKTVLYLSRYEVDPAIRSLHSQCSDEHYIGSHDALLLRTPVPDDLMKQLPFELGTWNMEVKVIDELIKRNYTVRNPCKSLRIWHFHSSEIRHRLLPSKEYITGKIWDETARRPEYL